MIKPPFRRVLIANRGEITIRVMRAASELGIATVAIYSREDRFSLHRTKADESYLVGEGQGALQAYLGIDEIIAVALRAKADAIHPGYGFLSESPEFAERCAAAGLVFIGPTPATMRTLGNKVAARNLAQQAGVPVMPATPPLPVELGQCAQLAAAVGYPVMLKASWGGGGRGMRVIENETQLVELLPLARSEALAAFGNDEVYLEKLVRRARHIVVQLLGDAHGNLVHLYERDCTVQRRNQKVVERAPAAFLSAVQRSELCSAALKIGRAANYCNAGTVEFLMYEDGSVYFIEMNARIQVEHPVTEMVTGVDLVKSQIRLAAGEKLADVVGQPVSRGHAIECRVNAEDPETFVPSPGRITVFRVPGGPGIRVDTAAYADAIIPPYYDSLIAKLIAFGDTREESIARMRRALEMFVVEGIKTSIPLHRKILADADFAAGRIDTHFLDRFATVLAG